MGIMDYVQKSATILHGAAANAGFSPNIVGEATVAHGKHIAGSEALKTVTKEAIKEATKIVHSQDVISDVLFWVLLGTALLIAFYCSQHWTYKDFYRPCFDDPIRAWGLEITIWFVNILEATSIVYYIWNAQLPAAGSDTQWFISLEYIWMGVQGIKLLWSVMFWRYYSHTVSLGIALVTIIILTLASLILSILFFVRAWWASAVLTLIVTFVYFLITIFCGYVFYRVWHGVEPHHHHGAAPHTHHHHHAMAGPYSNGMTASQLSKGYGKSMPLSTFASSSAKQQPIYQQSGPNYATNRFTKK